MLYDKEAGENRAKSVIKNAETMNSQLGTHYVFESASIAGLDSQGVRRLILEKRPALKKNHDARLFLLHGDIEQFTLNLKWLRGVYFFGCRFPRANFQGMKLRYVQFYHCDLRKADFRSIFNSNDFRHAHMDSCKVTGMLDENGNSNFL